MAQSKYYNTGGGTLYFTPIVNGVMGTEVDFGGTENVSFSSEIETLKHDNTEGGTTFEDLSILKKVTGKISIETLEASPAMLTRAFLGANNSAVVTATTDAALDNVTVAAFATAYPLSKKFLSNIVVKDDADLITYTLGVDYTLSTVDNVTSITFISGGAGGIVLTDVIHITADNLGYTNVSIEAFIDSKLEGQLRFVSDAANGLSYTYTFHKVSLLASGDYMLKSPTEFAKLSFEGSMLASELVTGTGISKLFKIEATELTAV